MIIWVTAYYTLFGAVLIFFSSVTDFFFWSGAECCSCSVEPKINAVSLWNCFTITFKLTWRWMSAYEYFFLIILLQSAN